MYGSTESGAPLASRSVKCSPASPPATCAPFALSQESVEPSSKRDGVLTPFPTKIASSASLGFHAIAGASPSVTDCTIVSANPFSCTASAKTKYSPDGRKGSAASNESESIATGCRCASGPSPSFFTRKRSSSVAWPGIRRLPGARNRRNPRSLRRESRVDRESQDASVRLGPTGPGRAAATGTRIVAHRHARNGGTKHRGGVRAVLYHPPDAPAREDDDDDRRAAPPHATRTPAHVASRRRAGQQRRLSRGGADDREHPRHEKHSHSGERDGHRAVHREHALRNGCVRHRGRAASAGSVDVHDHGIGSLPHHPKLECPQGRVPGHARGIVGRRCVLLVGPPRPCRRRYPPHPAAGR